jgi:nicotinamide riboside kinase
MDATGRTGGGAMKAMAADDALVFAIVGAECTGKTTLARGLADRITRETGLAATWVPEWLRTWCDREGRTPRPDEQAGVARAQQQQIEDACRRFPIVVCDTTPLMTAVYSQHLFGDASLLAAAADQQRRHALTLLTAPDLPWVADGIQRDGPQVREPVDALLRDALICNALPFVVIGGRGEARLDAALDAVSPRLRQRSAPGNGLFTRLARRDAAQPPWPWTCDRCDAPDCEHALRGGATAETSTAAKGRGRR